MTNLNSNTLSYNQLEPGNIYTIITELGVFDGYMDCRIPPFKRWYSHHANPQKKSDGWYSIHITLDMRKNWLSTGAKYNKLTRFSLIIKGNELTYEA